MKGATIYERGGTLFFCPSSLTTAGVWVGTEPVLKVKIGNAPTAIGEATIAALAASRELVAHPTDWSAVIAPLLQLAGVKSWGAFMKQAKCVSLRLKGDELEMHPHRDLGRAGGFEAIVEAATRLRYPSSASEIADAIIDSISLCH